MKLLLVRADASATIGTGHVFRCLAVAEAWRAAGGRVVFACREHPGHLCDRIMEAGFELARLPMGEGGDPDPVGPPHAHWLGASWREDATAMGAVIDAVPERPDWLLVDHYALDRRWERALRDRVGGLLVIDDLADRVHAPCLLLDQNLVEGMQSRYAGRLEEPSRLLLGLRYAPLRAEFAALRAPPRTRRGARVLLHLGGGSDHFDISGRALAALLSLSPPGLEIELVASAASVSELQRRFAAEPRVRVRAGLPSLAPLMAEADLGIGACGVAALERLCLGLPSLVISMAENQRGGAQELGRQGLIEYLGHHDAVDDAALRAGIAAMLARLPDAKWSQRCLDSVDGRGAERVLAAMAAGAPPRLLARLAELSDEARLLKWANDPLARANAFSPAPIPAAEHQRWLRTQLADAGCRLLVLEDTCAEPVGTVRFQREKVGWELHFNLAPSARGQGMGRGLVAVAIEALRDLEGQSALVFGRVKAENWASRRIFEALGFLPQLEPTEGVVAYRRDPAMPTTGC